MLCLSAVLIYVILIRFTNIILTNLLVFFEDIHKFAFGLMDLIWRKDLGKDFKRVI